MKLFILAVLLCLWTPLAAAPKRQPGVNPAKCAACHGADKVLPAGHPDLRKAGPGACAECHAKGTAADLRARLPLGHRHALAGVDCAACHGKGKPAAKAPASACIGCHELKALIARTAGAADQNPHEDRHGYSQNCNLCHHQHKASTNHCAGCHAFNWPVP